MAKKYRAHRQTPWDGIPEGEMTATQRLIRDHQNNRYQERHPVLSESGEADVINSFVPTKCPYCGSVSIHKKGLSADGIQRYTCKDCGRRFNPATGTIFDSRKISITEWIDYLYNLISYVSLNADAWNNKNSFTTSRYWLEKVFMILDNQQNDILLEGMVTLDETYYSVRTDDLTMVDGKRLKGLSKNQICIGVAVDDNTIYCVLEGFGKPSQKKTYEAFKDHIKPGSTLVHDKEKSHKKLVEVLNLVDQSYDAKALKKLPDEENPLYRVNHVHALIKRFFYAHSSFNRDSIKGYIELFTFIMNPPDDKLEKVEELLKRAFENPKTLRYRTFYQAKQGNE